MSKFVKLPNGIVTSVDESGYITATVEMQLSTFIDHNLETALDLMSNGATGSELLSDISYSVVGHTGNTLKIQVTGSIESIDDAEEVPEDKLPMSPKADLKPDIMPIAYWDSVIYGGSEPGDEKPFLVEVIDKRNASGQVFIDIGQENGPTELLAAVTVEVSRLPGGNEDVPCVHLHFDESNMAASFLKHGDRFVIRPETNVRILSGLLESGEHVWFLE